MHCVRVSRRVRSIWKTLCKHSVHDLHLQALSSTICDTRTENNLFMRCRHVQNHQPFSTEAPHFDSYIRQVGIQSYSKTFNAICDKLDKTDDHRMSMQEWETIEKEIENDKPSFLVTLDYSMMKHLRGQGKLDMAISFMDFIKSKRVPNQITVLEYVALCLAQNKDSGFEDFKSILEQNEYLHISKMNMVYHFALKSKYWKDAVPLIMKQLKHQKGMKEVRRNLEMDIIKSALINLDYAVLYRYLSDIPVSCDDEELAEFLFQMWLDRKIPLDVFLELLQIGNFPLSFPQSKVLTVRLKR